ncbi:hypothetical protein [Sporosarcina sp. D27]|uniref:hypothetical protein n=1 Tax=Sporosarcina sp. D27 TaxID=1382305 RepID=UPI0004708636|nr:hypothetical protein [Sporosarcina sp. D27]
MLTGDQERIAKSIAATVGMDRVLWWLDCSPLGVTGAAMAFSSVSVVLNALRLQRVNLRP